MLQNRDHHRSKSYDNFETARKASSFYNQFPLILIPNSLITFKAQRLKKKNKKSKDVEKFDILFILTISHFIFN